MTEIWYDGLDQNCDGNDQDQDGDGWGEEDCADDPTRRPPVREGFSSLESREVYPGALDRPYDGVDADCGGQHDDDADGDGFPSAVWGGEDCYDRLTDGWPNPAGLGPPAVFPGAVDLPYDGTDADCGGENDYDSDGDGVIIGLDCDDQDAEAAPGQTEQWYDGVDQDCDGNEGDADGDGWWIVGYAGIAGVPLPEGVLEGDCADDPQNPPAPVEGAAAVSADAIFPGAVDLPYDGIDADCSGDDDRDGDGDGYPQEGDCDDGDPAVFPNALESCDNRDNDCSGFPDDGGACPCAVQHLGLVPYLACGEGEGEAIVGSCALFGYVPVAGEDAAERSWLVTQGYAGSWLGLDDRTVEGDFRRWDGAAPATTAWAPGQPVEGGADCVYLGSDGLWNEAACSEPRPLLCRG